MARLWLMLAIGGGVLTLGACGASSQDASGNVGTVTESQDECSTFVMSALEDQGRPGNYLGGPAIVTFEKLADQYGEDSALYARVDQVFTAIQPEFRDLVDKHGLNEALQEVEPSTVKLCADQ